MSNFIHENLFVLFVGANRFAKFSAFQLNNIIKTENSRILFAYVLWSANMLINKYKTVLLLSVWYVSKLLKNIKDVCFYRCLNLSDQ